MSVFQKKDVGENKLFGHSKYVLTGNSGPIGFEIRITRANSTESFVAGIYRQGSKRLYRLLALLLFIIAWSSAFGILNRMNAFTWWRVFVVAGLFLSLLELALWLGQIIFLRPIKQWRRYHGAEHRLISTLSKSIPVTLDALSNEQSENANCGGRLITEKLTNIIFVSSGLMLTAFFVDPWYFTVPLAIGLLVLAHKTLHVVYLPLSYWLQKHITTATPDGMALQQAVDLGLQIEESYRQLMTPDMLHARGIRCESFWCYACPEKGPETSERV